MTKQTQVRSTEEAPARSALKLALEALTHFEKAGLATLKTVDAITAIREALAEHPAQTDWEAVAADQAMTIALLRAEQPAQPQQEPVLVVEVEPDYISGGHYHKGSKPYISLKKLWSIPIGTKLYTFGNLCPLAVAHGKFGNISEFKMNERIKELAE